MRAFVFQAVALLSLLLVSRAHAEEITVTTFADELNLDGDCSLREAVQAANTDSVVDACTAGDGEDIINIPPGRYALTLTGSNENSNATGDLDVSEAVTLLGTSAETTVLDASELGDRLVDAFAALTLEGLTLTGGRATTSSKHGGAIQAADDLTATRCIFSDNRGGTGTSEVDGGHGGAIALANFTVVAITDCLFDSNRGGTGGDASGTDHWTGRGGNGGAIYGNEPTSVVVEGSVFIGNASGSPGTATSLGSTGGYGGGGALSIGTEAFRVTNSAFINNAAGAPDDTLAETDSGGGAINAWRTHISQSTFEGNYANYGGGLAATDATVTNCTFVDNAAGREGGGLVIFGGTGNVSHSTFVHNIGGGIGSAYEATVNITNSIIADNKALDGESALDCLLVDAGVVSDRGHNLGVVGTDCGFSDETTVLVGTTDLIGVVLTEGGFDHHGGLGRTWAISEDSPAFEAGTCVDLDDEDVLVDGRGTARPAGDTCDIGAYELSACSSSCLTCDGPGDGRCTSCADGKFLSEGGCTLCSLCDDGEVVVDACTSEHDTVCALPGPDAGMDAEIALDASVDPDDASVDANLESDANVDADIEADAAVSLDASVDMFVSNDMSVVLDANVEADGGLISASGGCNCAVAEHDVRDDALTWLAALAFIGLVRRRRTFRS